MSNSQAVKIKATIMWAFLDRKDTTFNDEASAKYQVDLGYLSEAAVEKLEGMGVSVRNKQDKGSFITCKSKYPINAYDAEGITIVGNDRDTGKALEGNVKVGNGSAATVTLNFYDFKTPQGKAGTNATIKRLCITDLIEYEAEGGSDEDADLEAL